MTEKSVASFPEAKTNVGEGTLVERDDAGVAIE